MCGIVGYYGKSKANNILIDGLKKLEYRGYDSAGIATIYNDKVNITKAVGKIINLDKKIDYSNNDSIGMGHTRWATHGGVNITNCHPHTSKNTTIVHNGILENFNEIKNELLDLGYEFISETDTEVLCAYIDYIFSIETDILKALNKCINKFEGSYATIIYNKNYINKLFVLKKNSPLVIMENDDDIFIASDISAYSDKALRYIILDDGDIGVIDSKTLKIYNGMCEKNIKYNDIDIETEFDNLGSFDSYMFKEINDQVDLINKWNDMYLSNFKFNFDLKIYKNICIVACGTAYHSGLIGKYLIEEYLDIPVNVEIASEFRYKKNFLSKNSLVIFISQSGETADTIACAKIVKDMKIDSLGIINKENSSLSLLVDYVVYSKAGIEKSVASTKAYVSQIYIFSMLIIKSCNINLSDELSKLSSIVKKLINFDYNKIAEMINNKNSLFYLGRNIDYATSMEGALKIKEITYIHAEAYAFGELKHGTISLIDDSGVCIATITKKSIASKSLSNIKEVRARGAYVILVISNDLLNMVSEEYYDDVIIIPDVHELLMPIACIIPMQMIAYTTAKIKGVDIDMPRNLAKSVTVE